MARTTKTVKATATPATATATATEVVETAPVVVEKKVSKKASKKVEENVVLTTPVDVPATADIALKTEESTLVDAEVPVTEQSIEFHAKLQLLSGLLSSLKADYRTLERKWSRELKTAIKQSSKKKRKSGNRAPSGFVKPARISDELAKFLEKPVGTEMARTEVTRDINKYIRTNNLQDKKCGRKINPDNKLAALLKLNKNDELTYFNLQRYMSPHFAKSVKPVVESVEATV